MFGKKAEPEPEPPLLSQNAILMLCAAFVVLVLALSAKPARPGSVSAVRVYALCSALLAVGTIALHVSEEELAPIDAFYLSVMTFTTIGYGDLPHPRSAAGRAAIMLLALGGVSFFGITLPQPSSRLRFSLRCCAH